MVPPKDKKVELRPGADDDLVVAVTQVNRFMTDVVNGLDRGLTRSENARSQKKVLDFTTGAAVDSSFPMKIKCELSSRPEAIRCGQAVALNGGSFSGPVDVSQWDMADGTTIRFNKIWGLLANTHYQLTLFVE